MSNLSFARLWFCVGFLVALPGPWVNAFDAVTVEPIKPLLNDSITTIAHVHHTVFVPSTASRDAVQWRMLDESLLPTEANNLADVVSMIQMMDAAGFDAIVLRAHMDAVDFYMQAIEASGTAMKLVPLYNAEILARLSTNIDGWEGFYEKIKELCKKYYQDPRLYREEGRPVIYMYRACNDAFTPKSYEDLSHALTDAGFPIHLIGAFQPIKLQKREDPVAYLKPYAQQMGFFTWATPTEYKTANQQLYLQAMQGLGNRRFHATVSPGKWRAEMAQWYPSRGTKTFRKQIALAISGQPNAINFESWDDFSELEHLAPTMENDGALLELMTYLINGKGIQPTSIPRIFLSYPREVLRGRILDVEVLALPCNRHQKLLVRFEDQQGRVLKTFKPQTINRNSATALTFHMPTHDVDTSRAVYPIITLKDENSSHTYQGTGYLRIRTGILENQYDRHLSLHKLAEIPTLDFTINNAKPSSMINLKADQPIEASINIHSKTKLRRVDLIRNNMFPVHAWEPANPNTASGTRGIAVSWFTPASGFNQPYDFSGILTLNHGKILKGFMGRPSADQPCDIKPDHAQKIQWENKANANRIVIRTQMNDADQFRLSFPAFKKQWDFTWSDLTKRPFIQYQLSDHTIINIQRIDAPFGLARSLDKKNVTGQCTIDDTPNASPLDTYSIRVVDMNGKLYRSPAVWVKHSNQTRNITVPIWCEESKQVRHASLPEYEVPSNLWEFTEGSGSSAFCSNLTYGRRHWGCGGWGFTASLGGSPLRAGGFAVEGMPTWTTIKNTPMLHFDGNDRFSIPPGVLPIGAMTLQMRIKPIFTGKRAMLIDGLPMLRLYMEADGRLRVEDYTTQQQRTAFRSQTAIHDGQWATIALVNDLQTLTIYINGKPTGAIKRIIAPEVRLSKPLHVGTRQVTRDQFKEGFQGILSGMHITAQALSPEQFLLKP